MVAKTQYELTGEWTTNDNADVFMEQIGAETNAELSVIGQSFLGKDLYALTIGNGEVTTVISGGVHRSEPASREAVLQMTRDVAYNSNGKYNSYLATRKIIFIPSLSHDVENTRVNAQNININRDAYRLETPEMRWLMNLITDVKPELYVDFHERSGSLSQLEFIDPSGVDPNVISTVGRKSVDMVSRVRQDLETMGYVTAPYPQFIIGPGMTVAAASLLGCVSMTPETHHDNQDKNYRIQALKDTFDKTLEWHSSNTFKVEPEDLHLKPNQEFTLLNGNNQYYHDASRNKIVVPKGYNLDNLNEFEKFIETYNIIVEENFVPIEQPASRLLPHLLDPKSDMKVANAVRVEPDVTPRRTDGRYTKVLMDEWREVFIKSFYS